ncbi:hypothetical protein EDB84DRAFT_1442917 [Lactarius hengduanensis]|nr:hypothetical protein EDB84DRAFT_1442917 [Lactarius hengduanensis]
MSSEDTLVDHWKKKDKKKRSLAGLKDQYGPILERRKQKGAEVEGDGCVSHSALSAPHAHTHLLTHQIKVLSKRGAQVVCGFAEKQKGNNVHQARSFVKPKQYYTCAIEVPPHLEPVFYSNRTACYVVLEPPQHEDVVADCDKALNLRVMKTLYYTATTILSKFQNDVASRPRPLPTLPENPSTGDGTLILVETLMVPRLISRGLQLLPSLTQSRVKLASVHMEQTDVGKAFESFDVSILSRRASPRTTCRSVPTTCVQCMLLHLSLSGPRTRGPILTSWVVLAETGFAI